MNIEIGLRTDEFGRMLGADVHDSMLVEFAFSAAGTLYLGMQKTSEQTTSIALSGVSHMSANLLDGAVVSNVYVWTVDSVPENCWGTPDSGWNALLSARMKLADAKKEAKKISQEKPNSFLIQVECSYGGAIACVCDKVNISRTTKKS